MLTLTNAKVKLHTGSQGDDLFVEVGDAVQVHHLQYLSDHMDLFKCIFRSKKINVMRLL